jgi:hypothetical protein
VVTPSVPETQKLKTQNGRDAFQGTPPVCPWVMLACPFNAPSMLSLQWFFLVVIGSLRKLINTPSTLSKPYNEGRNCNEC